MLATMGETGCAHFGMVGHISVQKDRLSHAEQIGVRFQVGHLAGVLVQGIHKTTVAVVIAEHKVKIARAVRAHERIQPADGCPDGCLRGRECGPAKVKDVPAENKRLRLARRQLQRVGMQFRLTAAGKHVQVADEIASASHILNSSRYLSGLPKMRRA